MTLLLPIVGVVLLVLGALVLLVFPNRPGGEISWQGMKVSSPGAGLPILVLGAALLLATASTIPSSGPLQSLFSQTNTSATGRNGGCFEDYFVSIASDRISTVESGAQDAPLIGTDQPKGDPFGIMLTENNEPIGALRVTFFPANDFFRVASIVDGNCKDVSQFENASRGGDKRVAVNWDALQIRFADQFYLLRLGYDGASIGAQFMATTP